MMDSLAATRGTGAAASDLICGSPAGGFPSAGESCAQNCVPPCRLALADWVKYPLDQSHEAARRSQAKEAIPAARPAMYAGAGPRLRRFADATEITACGRRPAAWRFWFEFSHANSAVRPRAHSARRRLRAEPAAQVAAILRAL